MSDETPHEPRVLPFRRPDGTEPSAAATPEPPRSDPSLGLGVPPPPGVTAPSIVGPAQLLDLVRQHLALLGPLTLYIEQTRALAAQLRAGEPPDPVHLDAILANTTNDRARVELIREAYEQLKTMLEGKVT